MTTLDYYGNIRRPAITKLNYDKIKVGDRFKVVGLGAYDTPVKGSNVYTVIRVGEYPGFNDGEYRSFFDVINDEGQARFINRYNLQHWEQIEIVDLI